MLFIFTSGRPKVPSAEYSAEYSAECLVEAEYSVNVGSAKCQFTSPIEFFFAKTSHFNQCMWKVTINLFVHINI